MLALYGHPFSSYTWKALIPLYSMGTDFHFREVGPDEADNVAFVQKSHPAGRFPVLADGTTTIIEATGIIEYLAATYPQAAHLLPADPQQAATLRMLDRVFDNYVMSPMQTIVNAYMENADAPDQGTIENGREGLQRAYSWLEEWLSAHPLPPHVSLVTCAAAPSLFYADWVEPIPADCPRLAALRAELLALPAVSRCVEGARPYRPYFPPGAPDRD